MPPADQPRQREIRVYVSSTFRDLQEEREELANRIFPQLRRLCESRGVTWGEVDLRWGVPDEGKVLPLCLAEIERCRPYFIGLLGERYGGVPEQIPEELLAAQPWLDKHHEQSVTAIEVFHGVLRNPEMAEHAFFYFRDPRYAAAREGFTEEDPARRERLAALKAAIRGSGVPVAENFATPHQLGEWVLRDFTAVIDNLYPESSIPDPLVDHCLDQGDRTALQGALCNQAETLDWREDLVGTMFQEQEILCRELKSRGDYSGPRISDQAIS